MTTAKFAMMVRGEIPDTPEVREQIREAVENALRSKCQLEMLVVEYRKVDPSPPPADKCGNLVKYSCPYGCDIP